MNRFLAQNGHFDDFALQKPELIFKLRRSWKVVRVSKNAKFDEFSEKKCPDGQNSFFKKLRPKTCFSIFRRDFFWQKSRMRFELENVSWVAKIEKKTFFEKIQMISSFFRYGPLSWLKNSIFYILPKLGRFCENTKNAENDDFPWNLLFGDPNWSPSSEGAGKWPGCQKTRNDLYFQKKIVRMAKTHS